MQTLIAFIAHVAAPWAHLYNDHQSLQSAIAFVHVGALLVGGGVAVATDRLVLRTNGSIVDRTRTLYEIAGAHATVLAGLTFVALSGVLLFAADVKTFIVSPVYWSKIALIVLLLANGYRMSRIETRLRHASQADGDGWRQLRHAAVASITLWLTITLLGTLLVNTN